MASNMTLREMNLRVFKGESIPHVFFQPRFEPWYDWQLRFGDMPEQYEALGLRGTYRELGCSMRYVDYYTDMPHPVVRKYSREVKVNKWATPTHATEVIETPFGDLTQEYQYTVDETWREVTFPVKGPDDLKKLRWLLQHTALSFCEEYFVAGSHYVGDLGEPQFYLPKSPYQALAQSWMKLKDLIYALADCRDEVEATMQVIDDYQDQLYEGLCASGMVNIVNFGENIHDHLLSPRYWERYLMPWYEKRAGQLHRAGIYSHMHLDGYFHTLLKYLKDLPFDGIEALTPKPQGDVSLEELREHMGDKILVDGIPAVYFMAPYSREDLMECVETIARFFHPRLVLGVSDEVPEGAEPNEAVERIRMVAEWCKTH
jgi:hypothetical protein